VDHVEECEAAQSQSRVDASVSGGERKTPAADEKQAFGARDRSLCRFCFAAKREEREGDVLGRGAVSGVDEVVDFEAVGASGE
jgi:hypothetical protein